MSAIRLPQFSKARVLVVGDVMVDRYWSGHAQKISSEAPVPVVHVKDDEYRPGGAANVALNIAALGAKVSLIGVTGKDASAQRLEKILKDKKVKPHFLALSGQQTITKLRIMSQSQQLIRLDFEEACFEFEHEKLLKLFKKQLAHCDLVVLSDYAKGTLAPSQMMIQLAKAAKVPVLIDPKNADWRVYAGATLITPNFREFEDIVGVCHGEEDIEQKALELIHQFDLDALLVTRGAQGMSLVQTNAETVTIPTRAQQVYDVTGAGDTVIATLASALAAGEPLPNSVRLANSAAAVVVAKVGTSEITAPELRRLLHVLDHIGYGVVERQDLPTLIDDARTHGEKIVFTNGCFDILHAGHVNYLEKAKRHGDRLIVAVNDDDSIRRLKGDDRPVNTIKHRLAVIAALDCVDWAIAFSEDTPEALIKELKPDVLVKGEDYTVDTIVGADIVLRNGGQVKTIAFEEDCSTSKIIESIQQTQSSSENR